MSSFALDSRQVVRALGRRPGTTLASVVIVALGVALLITMFALADPYLFRELPYTRPQELATLTVSALMPNATPTLDDWRRRVDLFQGIAAYGKSESSLVIWGEVQVPLLSASVSSDFFRVLGVPVQVPPDWDRAHSRQSVPILLSSASARELFGTVDPRGQILRGPLTSDRTFRVVDVLPSTFLFPFVRLDRGIRAYVPLSEERIVQPDPSPGGGGRGSAVLWIVARLSEAATPAGVSAALSTARDAPGGVLQAPSGLSVRAESLQDVLTAHLWKPAAGAFAAGLLILLACAANVANLNLVRDAARERELVTRAALGAPASARLRLAVLELTVVTVLGVIGGLILAVVALAAVVTIAPAEFLALGIPAISLRAVLCGASAGLVVVLVGSLPALLRSPAFSAQSGRRPDHDSNRMRRVRFVMIAAQSAVAVVLLGGAALLGRSYLILTNQDPGFARDTVALTVRYPSGHIGAPLKTEVEATVTRLQRIVPDGLVGAMTGGLVDSMALGRAGLPVAVNGRKIAAMVRQVTPTFFSVARSRLLLGGLPRSGDSRRFAVVTESIRQACCAGTESVGLTVESPAGSHEIIGVVSDFYPYGLGSPSVPTVFVPLESPSFGWINYVFRGDAIDRSLLIAAEREIRAVNRLAELLDKSSLNERLGRSIADRSFSVLILLLFAIAATTVSAAGIVGIVAFIVARRTRELAIRLVLGAEARNVRYLVARDAVTAAAGGVAAGFLAALWLSDLVESQLHGIDSRDPVSFLAVLGVITVVVGAASWIPAGRTLRLSPLEALRID